MAANREVSQHPSSVNSEMPRCDCHVHVFSPREFKYVESRRFTPGEASVEQLRSHLDSLGMTRVVLVQPSVYGEDSACLVNSLNLLGGLARGIAVIPPQITRAELELLHRAGVRGARLNLAVNNVESADYAIDRLTELESICPPEWHIQLHASAKVLQSVASHIEHSARIYVIDHLGLPNVAQGVDSESWRSLLALIAGGNVYLKLSGPYLSSTDAVAYRDLAPFLRSLFGLRRDRLLWGSNWPHTQGTSRNLSGDVHEVEPFRNVDDRIWLSSCVDAGGEDIHSQLSENAQRLYGFA